MKFKILISTLICTFIFSGNAMALKCGNTFVKKGITSIEVLNRCGEPRAKEVVKQGGKSGKITERWTYGPYKGYFYLLYFKGGVLDKKESVRQ